MIPNFKWIQSKSLFYILTGSILLAFGLYQVHSVARITEGGVLGLVLLFEHWFHVSPSITSLIFNTICYMIGWHVLGNAFICSSCVATLCFSLTYAICEHFPPLWPNLIHHPFISAIAGALFVGIGVGLCVKAGAAPSGDDALAMSLSTVFKLRIGIIYLISDLIVLVLSLSYIPIQRIFFSLITVILSGQIIDGMQKVHRIFS